MSNALTPQYKNHARSESICKKIVRYYILWMEMIIAEMYNSLQSATAVEDNEHFTPTINSDSDEPQ